MQLPTDDPRGRQLFTRVGSGGPCWQEYVLPEILAITGISLLGKRLQEAGQEGVYSAISRVACHGLARIDRGIGESSRCDRFIIRRADILRRRLERICFGPRTICSVACRRRRREYRKIAE